MTEIILQKKREFFANNDCYDLHFTKGITLNWYFRSPNRYSLHTSFYLENYTMLLQYKPM